MIAGIGIDMIDVDRIASKLEANPAFKTHVFSEAEIAYCEKQKKQAMHFAARWAAKEAYLKAIGVNFIGNHRLPEIETMHQENGKPFIRLSGKALREFEAMPYGSIHLSISHTDSCAIAYVVIEKFAV